MTSEADIIEGRIRAHAFAKLNSEKRSTTNLYIDPRTYKKGTRLGPAFQKIVVPKPSILVFADDDPMANFGHDCRYLLYSPERGELHSEIPARFPPYIGKRPDSLQPFHEPVRFQVPAVYFRIPPPRLCPIRIPDGNRYAILYSGMSNMRHLNDLEFCYRMLIDRYGFEQQNIYVLNYDGTLNTQDGAAAVWPGNNSAYRIKITGRGDRPGFQAALAALKSRLKARDLLFIHTNNHGDNFGAGSFLCTYPSYGTYMASDFCADLAGLPKYRALAVMLEQCNAGGFNAPILASSTAASTSVSSAAIATQSSYSSPDGHWDSFARDWVAAQMGHDPYGAALSFNPDTNSDGVVEATEAFNYAVAVKNPSDTPNFSESSAVGGNLALSQQYVWWWWWCIWWHRIIEPLLAKYPPAPPDPEYYQAIHRLAPELQDLLVSSVETMDRKLQTRLAKKVKTLIATQVAEKSR